MPDLFIFPKKLQTPRTLTEVQLWSLINCHSYLKYWWYRMIYEYGYAGVRESEGKDPFCPFCALPPEIYPRLMCVDNTPYENAYFTSVIDELAEKEYREQTILLVHSIHVEAIEGDSLKSSLYLHLMKDRLRHHRMARYGREYGMWFHYEGRDKDTIDPIPNHYYETLLIPDETGEVRVPAYKSPARLREIHERALGFALRYEAGEIPE